MSDGTLECPAVDAILVFTLEGQRFGLPATDVRELVRAARITPLPRAPEVVEGLLDLRGELVPVFDVRRRFRLPARALHPDEHFIIAQAGARKVALRVSRAEGLEPVAPGELDPAPLDWPGVGHVSGVVKRADGMVLVHDLATFLSEAEARALEAALVEGAGDR